MGHLQDDVSSLHECFVFPIQVNIIQYKFYCQLPMGAFQRQILIVQVIKKETNKHSNKKYSRIVNKQIIKKELL